MWLQERVLYTICIDDFNRKMGFCLDQKGYTAPMLMDLSKAFDRINHELLIAKLHAYCFSKDAQEIIPSYLSDRFQRININTIHSRHAI